MNDKALLVISFGSSYTDSLRNSIEATEWNLAANFPDYDLKRAFTSRVVINILKTRDGIHIDTPREALEKLSQEGYREVLIQPLHVIPGIEYQKIISDLDSVRDRFEKLTMGRPLLGAAIDFDSVAEALSEQMPPLAADEGWLWMGHGSAHSANGAYAELELAFRRRGLEQVWIATVEGAPTLDDLMPDLKTKKIRRIYLQPLMLVSGDHAHNDMAGPNEDSWKTILEQAEVEVIIRMTSLGEMPRIRQIFADHATEALQGEPL